MTRTARLEFWDGVALVCTVVANHSLGARSPRRLADFHPLRRPAAGGGVRVLSPEESLKDLEKFVPRAREGARRS